MYITNMAEPLYSNRIFASVCKIYELLKLSLKPSVHTQNSSKEYLPYILQAMAKGYTVLDIGSHKKEYCFDLFKISKLSGKLITFEQSDETYNYLCRMKKLSKLDNITVDPLFVPANNKAVSTKRRKASGATVIDFKVKINKKENDSTGNTVDDYCADNFIVPALIKVRLDGGKLEVLQGAKEVLRKYKPGILIECASNVACRETLITSFKFLSDLCYAGYFILDEIKVPLANFDFNIYQNEVLGFYCNNFYFE